MKRRNIFALLFLPLVLGSITAQAGPRYENEETQRIIEAMVEAHGGLERWQAAPAIRFDNIMYNTRHRREAFAWWIAHEVIDQKTRKAWQHWPMDNADIGYDGEIVWSVDWQRGNPSPHMVHFFYFFVNLPWLTQDDSVILSAPTEFQWPGTEEKLHEIRMTFTEAPGIGKSSNDLYVLYVDSETYKLVGYQYGAGYKPLMKVMGLPEEREIFGPLWRQITVYEEVDGLIFPSAFRTMRKPGEDIIGNHVILNIDVSTPFEHEFAERPENGVIYEGELQTNLPKQ